MPVQCENNKNGEIRSYEMDFVIFYIFREQKG